MTELVVTAGPVVQVVGDAVVAALGAPGFDGWTVLDGIDPQQAYEAKSVTVGGTWDPDAQVLTSDGTVLVDTVEQGAGRRLVETTSVLCLAYSGGGEDGFAQHREAVNDVLTAIRRALRALSDVDGHSARAQIPSQQWASVRDDAGLGAMALFTVTVTVLP